MLSQQELDNLLTSLKEPNKPFEQIAQTFYRSFTKPDQFKAGCVICMLIQDNLLTQTQRLVGFYLLYDIYRQETEATTPFVPLCWRWWRQQMTWQKESSCCSSCRPYPRNCQSKVCRAFSKAVIRQRIRSSQTWTLYGGCIRRVLRW